MWALYVIECRDPAGRLDFTGKQPEEVFGTSAIMGITENAMAKAVWRHAPDATLDGRSVSAWPKFIDSRWHARVKTW